MSAEEEEDFWQHTANSFPSKTIRSRFPLEQKHILFEYSSIHFISGNIHTAMCKYSSS